jgi:hypothetical protein
MYGITATTPVPHPVSIVLAFMKTCDKKGQGNP